MINYSMTVFAIHKKFISKKFALNLGFEVFINFFIIPPKIGVLIIEETLFQTIPNG